jgi:NAD(P)-dependent dehydrogenase (short-subunit alcohol dehydrogenase family)
MRKRFSIEDKVIIVTGGTGVLGHSFINALAEQGAIIGVLGRNEKVAKERVKEIVKRGGRACALVADVLSQEQLLTARDLLVKEYGKIDGLINAAGGNMPDATLEPGEDIFKMKMESIREVMDLNLFGTLLPVQVFGETIIQTAGKGSIINISSVSAGSAVTRVLGYSLAKTSIEAYTKWFAVELANRYGDNLRINALVPGFFVAEQNRKLLTQEDGSYTDRGNKVIKQTPFNRFGKPDELTGALIWLLSDDSSFVSGASVVVDGGFTVFSGV